MSTIDLIGFTGVLLILIAYFLNLNNKLKSDDLSYILMNLSGAILACLASVLMAYYPFVLLEGVWTIVSVFALFKYTKRNGIAVDKKFGQGELKNSSIKKA